MKKRSEDVRAELFKARSAFPAGTVLSHYKGGTYLVVGHGFDTERQEPNISYRRIAGPSYDRIMEVGVVYHRPVSLFTKDRFHIIG